MRRWFFAHTYLQVALQIVIGLVPYGLGLVWAVSKGRIWEIDGISAGKELEHVEANLFEAPMEER
jgi:hypothetical protein